MANYTTGVVQLKWLNLFNTKLSLSGEPKYSATILFPKAPTEHCPDAVEQVARIKAELLAVAEAKFGKGARGLAFPLKDGDTVKEFDPEPKYPGFFYLVANAGEHYPPVVVDGGQNPVGPRSVWGSGDWGKAILSPFSYDVKANKGVSCGLRGIQFLYKGEGVNDYAISFEPVPDAHIGTLTEVPRNPDDEYDPFAE